jgi:hypothetical protein
MQNPAHPDLSSSRTQTTRRYAPQIDRAAHGLQKLHHNFISRGFGNASLEKDVWERKKNAL